MPASSKPLRVGVVGVGQMGQNHLRVYDRLKGVEIGGVFDTEPGRAREAAERYGTIAFPSLERLAAVIDAASVCVPSSAHADVGVLLLDRGVPCLIEKPLASTEAEVRRILAAAAGSGAPLMVGHVERFNPAVQELANLLEANCRVYALGTRRLSRANPRITDVDVVLDLMVHDLDIVLSLVGRSPVSIAASGVISGQNQGGHDYVTGLLSFAGGVTAHLTASRITPNKVRELHLTTDLGFVACNYLTQEVLVFRQGVSDRPPFHWSHDTRAALDSVVERLLIRNAEPLVLELEHFMECARTGATPLVTGAHALETLRAAWTIQSELARGANS